VACLTSLLWHRSHLAIDIIRYNDYRQDAGITGDSGNNFIIITIGSLFVIVTSGIRPKVRSHADNLFWSHVIIIQFEF
jgi:hypothetical protein